MQYVVIKFRVDGFESDAIGFLDYMAQAAKDNEDYNTEWLDDEIHSDLDEGEGD